MKLPEINLTHAAGEFVVNKSSDIGEKKKSISNIEMDRRTFLKAVGMLGAATLTGAYTTDIVKALENLDSGKNNVCVLTSLFGQGKTTSSIILEKMYTSRGLKVACLQSIKSEYDVGLYLKNNCHHYSLPIEAAKNKKSFEDWLPQGYDLYIVEITIPYGPIGAAFIDLFSNINEVVSYELKDKWESFVKTTDPAFESFWDHVNNRNIQKLITQVPIDVKVDETFIDTNLNAYNTVNLNFDSFTPRMKLPISKKTAIAVGAFPGEYKDIFPNFEWYEYNYSTFIKRYEKEDYDIAIIGNCNNEKIKFNYTPKNAGVICYQPSLYKKTTAYSSICEVKSDLSTIYSKIKEKNTDVSLGDEGCMYSSYNNKYWTYQPYPDLDIIERNENLTICNGWILPQYLIKEGMLEV